MNAGLMNLLEIWNASSVVLQLPCEHVGEQCVLLKIGVQLAGMTEWNLVGWMQE